MSSDGWEVELRPKSTPLPLRRRRGRLSLRSVVPTTPRSLAILCLTAAALLGCGRAPEGAPGERTGALRMPCPAHASAAIARPGQPGAGSWCLFPVALSALPGSAVPTAILPGADRPGGDDAAPTARPLRRSVDPISARGPPAG